MTDKKKPDHLKVLDFPTGKSDEEQLPPPTLIKKLDELVERAKDGKVKRVIVSYGYETEEEGEVGIDGEMFFWHDQNNTYEIIGAIESLKTIAVGMALGGMSSMVVEE